MSQNKPSLERWNELASLLREYRDGLQEEWGDLDDLQVATYVSGAGTREQRAAIEQLMREKPSVRRLVWGVQQVTQPVWQEAPSEAVASPMQRGAQVLRDRIAVWMGEAGDMLASGMEMLQPLPELRLEPDLDGSESSATERRWEVPIDQWRCILELRVRPGSRPDCWQVACNILGPAARQVLTESTLVLSQPNDLPLIKARMSNVSGKYTELDAGYWTLSLQRGEDSRVVPLDLGKA